jgi:hypothetical protein
MRWAVRLDPPGTRTRSPTSRPEASTHTLKRLLRERTALSWPPEKNVDLQVWSADDPDTMVRNRFGKDDNKNVGPLLYEDRKIATGLAYANVDEARAKLVERAFAPSTAKGKKRKSIILDVATDGLEKAAKREATAMEIERLIQSALAGRQITRIDAEIICKHYLEEITEAQLAQEYGGSQQAMGENQENPGKAPR